MPTMAHSGTALFLKRWLRQPLAVGAVVPSGRWLTDRIARTTMAAMKDHAGHVIELGAGTGQVTRALLQAGIPTARLALIERDREMTSFLKHHFSGLRIIEGDAVRLPELLAANGINQVAAVVSSLPLLSLPADVVDGIVRGVFDVLPRGGAMVQFTYGPAPPVPLVLREGLKLIGTRSARIWRNVPPAVVWAFTRPSS